MTRSSGVLGFVTAAGLASALSGCGQPPSFNDESSAAAAGDADATGDDSGDAVGASGDGSHQPSGPGGAGGTFGSLPGAGAGDGTEGDGAGDGDGNSGGNGTTGDGTNGDGTNGDGTNGDGTNSDGNGAGPDDASNNPTGSGDDPTGTDTTGTTGTTGTGGTPDTPASPDPVPPGFNPDEGPIRYVQKVGVNFEDLNGSQGSDFDFNDVVLCFTGDFSVQNTAVMSNAVQTIAATVFSASGCDHRVDVRIVDADGHVTPMSFPSKGTGSVNLVFKGGSRLEVVEVPIAGPCTYTHTMHDVEYARVKPDLCNLSGN